MKEVEFKERYLWIKSVRLSASSNSEHCPNFLEELFRLLGDRSLLGGRILGGDHLIFGRTHGGVSSKRGAIAENLEGLKGGTTYIFLQNEDMGDHESHQKLLGGITSVK